MRLSQLVICLQSDLKLRTRLPRCQLVLAKDAVAHRTIKELRSPVPTFSTVFASFRSQVVTHQALICDGVSFISRSSNTKGSLGDSCSVLTIKTIAPILRVPKPIGAVAFLTAV